MITKGVRYMIVEITEEDIKKIGAALSSQMIDTIDNIWSGAFGIPKTADPIEILSLLNNLANDHNSSDGVQVTTFAAFLEVEGYGLLYKKLLTGEDHSGYLENGTIEDFLDN